MHPTDDQMDALICEIYEYIHENSIYDPVSLPETYMKHLYPDDTADRWVPV